MNKELVVITFSFLFVIALLVLAAVAFKNKQDYELMKAEFMYTPERFKEECLSFGNIYDEKTGSCSGNYADLAYLDEPSDECAKTTGCIWSIKDKDGRLIVTDAATGEILHESKPGSNIWVKREKN